MSKIRFIDLIILYCKFFISNKFYYMLKILSVFLILNLSILSLANALEQDMKGNFNNQNENFNSDDMDSKMFK